MKTFKLSIGALLMLWTLFSLYYFALNAANFNVDETLFGMIMAMISAFGGVYLFKSVE